ncbi:MAG: LysM peptidoglycan-binding domain-containing protein [Phascolarctobacterium sp.]|nr:LysM peptidoglycan-binding domain-containing protein [Phascolarctobacterium sp.]
MKLTILCVLAFLAGMYVQQLLYPPVYQTQVAWHTVKAGETFWGIACEYFDQQQKYETLNEFLYDFRKANEHRFKGRFIQPGDVVYVPLKVRVK